MVGLAFAAQLLTQSSASLQTMYYQQQAREAAESGAVLAATCVKRDTLTLAVTITPKTNCYGTSVSTQNLYLVQDSRFRTTYSLVFAKNGAMTAANITGKTEVLRKSDGAVIASYSYNLKQNISHEVDVTGARATKRWWYFGSNVKLDFKKDALRAIANIAIEQKTSARGLRGTVEALLGPIMYDYPMHDDIKEIIITKDLVNGLKNK